MLNWHTLKYSVSFYSYSTNADVITEHGKSFQHCCLERAIKFFKQVLGIEAINYNEQLDIYMKQVLLSTGFIYINEVEQYGEMEFYNT